MHWEFNEVGKYMIHCHLHHNFCLSNATHSIGQSIKSPECPCVRACVRASYIS